MSTEEYADSKQETLDQLGELNQSLSKLKQGNLSLIDDVNRMQLAIQAAISNAFHTPDVIRMFAKKQQPLLRQRLVDIEAGVRQGKRDDIMLKLEILSALHKLGDALTDDEQQFVNVHSGMMSGAAFELASSTISKRPRIYALIKELHFSCCYFCSIELYF